MADLRQLGEVVEAVYEFTLSYAAQGHAPAPGEAADAAVRAQLARAAGAVAALAGSPQAELPARFAALLREDAGRAGAALELVLAQPAISSAMIESFNASLHVRALLADLFLVGEATNVAPQAARSFSEPA